VWQLAIHGSRFKKHGLAAAITNRNEYLMTILVTVSRLKNGNLDNYLNSGENNQIKVLRSNYKLFW